ncbi:toll/interleukin-1 receptor domain-containing protein [Pseudovibrio exalbescens]|uniref:toll/interleukin-1 receptor domain-containing protein n=1 Tax=Pseudovibrio exalbescens TaxID=197461 RepID=UPI000C9B69A9|nr:toll/interleukin-1 receptor domain-containing protein [Pseudovibrio exalbescens]
MNAKLDMKQPKVFISYNWTDEAHKERVREWADRLVGDGVDVVIDVYDLNPGDDKFAFMESMVQDPEITHVLLICDKEYVEKANTRRAGVGTETQIVSQEVYNKTSGSKFIPVFCEYKDDGNPLLPTYISSRISFNFTTPEKANDEWEDLVRFLFGKPRYRKPALGAKPAYLLEETALPTSGATTKLRSLEHALKDDKRNVPLLRQDFIDECMSYAEGLRILEEPNEVEWGKRFVTDFEKLTLIRNLLIDWIMLEGRLQRDDLSFSDVIIDLLEKIMQLRYRPAHIMQWNKLWAEAHSLFAYDFFLYLVAALIKTKNFTCLTNIFEARFILPETERGGFMDSACCDIFLHQTSFENEYEIYLGKRYYSPEAEILKRQSSRKDLPFVDLIQADVICYLVIKLKYMGWWLPQTVNYVGFNQTLEIFIRMQQKREFKRIAGLFGVTDGDDLRSKIEKGSISDIRRTGHFRLDLSRLLNLEKLDTI